MMGPCRVTVTSNATSGLPLTWITWWSISGFCQPVGVWYSPAALKFSTNRSCTSGLRLVNPQAMRWLCPTLMKGRPGREKPSTLKSPEWSCTSYHTPGTRCGKCISLESSGLPETVCAPETTQLLEPGKQASQVSGSCMRAEIACFDGNDARDCEDEVVFGRLPEPSGTVDGKPASLAGGWSCHESGGYRSAINSGESLALIFSRQYSVSYCGLSNWLMPMPTRSESAAVHGRGLYPRMRNSMGSLSWC